MATLSDARILVVDDEPALREIFAKWLALLGCSHVGTAANGQAALDALRQTPADVLLTDLRMPVMDGVTLVRRLAELGLTIPSIILVSGFGDVNEKEMYDLGVEAFLSKPLHREVLVGILQRAVAERSTLWREPLDVLPRQTILLQAKDLCETHLPSPSIRCVHLGRGGFSAHYPNPITLGRVAFHCTFTESGREMTGQGFVRWHSRADKTVGIEFCFLDPACRAWILEEIQTKAPRSFIPIL